MRYKQGDRYNGKLTQKHYLRSNKYFTLYDLSEVVDLVDDTLFPFYLYVADPEAYECIFLYFYANIARDHKPEAVVYILETLCRQRDVKML